MGSTDDVGLMPLTDDEMALADGMKWPTREKVPV
jgi:hypothetical protein